jgi:hypothetical protein
VTVVAPAIGNAIFAATGARLRHLPITPEAVKHALGKGGRRVGQGASGEPDARRELADGARYRLVLGRAAMVA